VLAARCGLKWDQFSRTVCWWAGTSVKRGPNRPQSGKRFLETVGGKWLQRIAARGAPGEVYPSPVPTTLVKSVNAFNGAFREYGSTAAPVRKR